MMNFITILLICFILFLIFILKKRKVKFGINIKKLYSNKSANITSNRNKNNISKQNSFYYQPEENIYSEFHKRALRNKMYKLFQSNKKDKLKALNIAEKLSDKSTLPIIRRGLKDTSPEIVKKSADLIRNFK